MSEETKNNGADDNNSTSNSTGADKVTYITLTQEQFNQLFNKKNDENNSGTLNEAKNALKDEQSNQESRAEMEQAIKFNLAADDYIKQNKEILPEEAQKIIEVVNAKKFSSEAEKAQEIKKTLIQSFIQFEENIKNLPGSIKAQVDLFNQLTEREKSRRAGDFWGIVEVGVECKKLARKAEILQNNGGYSSEGNNAFEERFLKMSETFLKEKSK
jgi:hypothetical protein